MRKSKQDFWAGISFILIGAAFGVQYDELTGVSRIFPEILISIIILGGIYFVIKGLVQNYLEKKLTQSLSSSPQETKKSDEIKENCCVAEDAVESISWSRILIISIFAVLLVFSLEYIGFFVSSLAFVVISYLFLGDKSLQRSLLVRSLIFAVPFIIIVWILFVKLLHVPTPAGILF